MPRTRSTHTRLGLAAVLGAFLAWRMYTAAAGSKWQPASRRAVARMLEMAGLRPQETLVDLGSGDGRIVLRAAKVYRARAIGVEIDPLRAAIARTRIRLAGLRHRARIVRGDLFEADLSGADVVCVFLSRRANELLESKLRRELTSGVRIVSYRHTFPSLKPFAEDSRLGIRVYLAEE